MIVATFDPQNTAFRKYLFRGEDILYWTSRFFSEIPFFPPDEIRGNFQLAVVFDFSKFLAIDPGQVRALNRLFRNQNTLPEIFSLPGYPFFALPKPALERSKLKIGKGICRVMAKTGGIRLVELKSHCPVLNVKDQLIRIEEHILKYQIDGLLRENVIIEDYSNFYIDGKVTIGKGSRIGSGVVIKGNSHIGKNVVIYPNSYIEGTTIADHCTVLPHCVLMDSILERDARVGPYTHLRNNSVLRQGAKAGNFVELKKSTLGRGSKAMHLSYIGDTTIGKHANIGAGTITCNYDGKKKHTTTIGDNVFIGSGTELVAPLKIGRNSTVGAGSTITEDIPDDSLAIAREKQVTKPGWAKKKKKSKP
jgi:bifunctional N-acetylglucosamine-1-phosphate-uridyltransferase/glucosamine-1-phosphate-acetyltransferase GlmU-like protein